MNTENTLFENTKDFIKHEMGAVLKVKVWNGDYANEVVTSLIGGDRPGAMPSVRAMARVKSFEQFTPGDEALAWRDKGWGIAEVVERIDLSEVSVEDFREWLEQVKVQAKRWS